MIPETSGHYCVTILALLTTLNTSIYCFHKCHAAYQFFSFYIILMSLICLIGLEPLCLVQLEAEWRMESCNPWRVPSLLAVHQSARPLGLDASWTGRWEANRLISHPFRRGKFAVVAEHRRFRVNDHVQLAGQMLCMCHDVSPKAPFTKFQCRC